MIQLGRTPFTNGALVVTKTVLAGIPIEKQGNLRRKGTRLPLTQRCFKDIFYNLFGAP
jgi:hypothetical protein